MKPVRKESTSNVNITISRCNQTTPSAQDLLLTSPAKVIPKRMQSSGNLLVKTEGVLLKSPA